MKCRAVAVALLVVASCGGLPSVPEHDAAAVVPAGIRRLTSYEYDLAASELLGRSVKPAEHWPADTPQHGFTRSRAQVVDPLLASRLDDSARTLADEAIAAGFADGLICDLTSLECATGVVQELGARAFRRPLSEAETARYLAVVEAGKSDDDPRASIALLLRALLQSPGILYVTELGSAAAADTTLDDHELASALAFGVTGLPPDAELLAAAAQGTLRLAAGRQQQALRMLGRPEARHHYRRFVEEWLGIAELSRVTKDAVAYPDFPGLRSMLLAETRTFVDQVLIGEGASIRALLAGGVGPRVGILQQRSFLAAHAHETHSAPVLRGVTVLRRVLCRTLPNPMELGFEIAFPPPDDTLTTRERYDTHAADAVCAGCHRAIDAVGFTFENFDAIGEIREVENEKPVDTSGFVELGSEDLPLADSADLSRALAEDPEVLSCVARQLFRFMTGLDSPDGEVAFVSESATLPLAERGSLVGLALGYVKSPMFARRFVP